MRIGVKVINHYGDEVMTIYDINPAGAGVAVSESSAG